MVSTVQTAWYVPAQYRQMPQDAQPALEFRYISRNERKRVERLFAQAATAEAEAYFDAIREGLLVALAGWRNYPIPYDPQRLDDVLTDVEYAELRQQLLPTLAASQSFCVACANTRPSTQANSASDMAATA